MTFFILEMSFFLDKVFIFLIIKYMINIYKRLNSAIDYIENNLFEDHDNKKIYQILELNSSVANPVFELFVGYTIKDYIRKRRLSEAVFMIKNDRIIDVAIACGYNTREGFSRAFRSFHGVNPSRCVSSFNFLERVYFDEELLSHPIKKCNYEDFNNKK